MKNNLRKPLGVIARYLFLLLASLFLPLFYSVLLSLTILPVYFILSLFYPVQLIANVLLINESIIEITDACLAGSAFYLLLVLVFSTYGIGLKKRVFILLFDSFLLLLINIVRITVFSIAFASNFIYFNAFHNFFWYFLSTVFVILIWLLTIRLFKIKHIPFYSDILYLIKKRSARKSGFRRTKNSKNF